MGVPVPIEARLAAMQDRQAEFADWLQRIELAMGGGLREITEIHTELKRLNGNVRDVMAEIGGAPDYLSRGNRPNLRARIHTVEQEHHAIRLLGEGLREQMQAFGESVNKLQRANEDEELREQTMRTLRAGERDRWSRAQKIFLFVFAFIGAIGTLVSVVVLLTHA